MSRRGDPPRAGSRCPSLPLGENSDAGNPEESSEGFLAFQPSLRITSRISFMSCLEALSARNIS